MTTQELLNYLRDRAPQYQWGVEPEGDIVKAHITDTVEMLVFSYYDSINERHTSGVDILDKNQKDSILFSQVVLDPTPIGKPISDALTYLFLKKVGV